jgi:hypothetical protein
MGQRGILRLIAVHTCCLMGTMRTNINDTEWLLLYVQEIWSPYSAVQKPINKPYASYWSVKNVQILSSGFCTCNWYW